MVWNSKIKVKDLKKTEMVTVKISNKDVNKYLLNKTPNQIITLSFINRYK